MGNGQILRQGSAAVGGGCDVAAQRNGQHGCGHGGRRGKAILRAFGQGALEHTHEVGRQFSQKRGVDEQWIVDVRVQDLRCTAHKGQPPGDAAIENRTQCINVGAAVNCAAARGLFGGHVGRSAHSAPCAGQFGRIHSARNAKVREQRHNWILKRFELHAAGCAAPHGAQQNIARLHVAMNDARFMRKRKGVGNGHKERARFAREQCAPLDEQIGKAFALHQLHGNVGNLALGRRTHLQNAHHIGMAQRACCERLAPEACVALLIGRGQQHLERDRLPLHLVKGTVDGGNAAAANALANQVAPNLAARQVREANPGWAVAGAIVRAPPAAAAAVCAVTV